MNSLQTPVRVSFIRSFVLSVFLTLILDDRGDFKYGVEVDAVWTTTLALPALQEIEGVNNWGCGVDVAARVGSSEMLAPLQGYGQALGVFLKTGWCGTHGNVLSLKQLHPKHQLSTRR